MKKFDAKKETEKVIEFIQNYYQDNHLKGVVLGISGGKDSGVVAGLFVKALGKENVIGITLPCHSKEDDRNDAKLVSDFYGFALYNFDLTPVFDQFKSNIFQEFGPLKDELINSDINLKPRLRMSTLYYYAALMSELKGETYLVAGTSNKAELYVGYFTKGGDSVHDIAVLSDFTVEEVIQIGECLEVPAPVLYKTPSDGLSNQDDEDKLGVRYSSIAAYLHGETVDEFVKNKIEGLHAKNQHKFFIPSYKQED